MSFSISIKHFTLLMVNSALGRVESFFIPYSKLNIVHFSLCVLNFSIIQLTVRHIATWNPDSGNGEKNSFLQFFSLLLWVSLSTSLGKRTKQQMEMVKMQFLHFFMWSKYIRYFSVTQSEL